MTPQRTKSKIDGLLFLQAICCLLLVVGTINFAYASKSNPQDLPEYEQKYPIIDVHIGKGTVFPLPTGTSDVLIANTGIAEVTPLQSGQLYIAGVTAGDTNVIVIDAQGNVIGQYEIHVRYDTSAIQKLVERLFPDEDVKIDSIHDQLILTGHASTPEKASKIANLVGHYISDLQDENNKTIDQLVSNLMTVGGTQQVMLRVKIAEVSRSILKEFGVETSSNDPDELAVTTLFGRNPASSVIDGSDSLSTIISNSRTGLTADPFASLSAMADTGINGIGFVNVFLNMLEQDNLANILAEPNLTAVTGEEAGFLAGGEFPVPVGRDRNGNVIIEFRPFGVSLNFRPKVMSEDRISLQLNTEVSSLDFESSVTLAEINVPGLDIRRAETTVELPSGGTLMIGGLLQSENIKGLSGLPGIMNTPVLGDLVKSDSFQRSETELVVMVTAYLVEPYADKEQAVAVKKERAQNLSRSFASNMKKIYGDKGKAALADEKDKIGYLID
ncbi:MAG: type II and III secretion system protein family protein [Rhodospirillales bacterium]|nr:type II and III secretion system protein family protein [Rhodospirillales bacterium]